MSDLNRRGAKTLTQMAAELGATMTTREGLASARSLGPLDGALGVGRGDMGRPLERDRQRPVGRLADEQRSGELKAGLDLSRALPLAGSDEPDGDLMQVSAMAMRLLAGLPDSLV